ncbi:MAG TPA: phosphatase PAP2 family protein [Candidatus Babeliales bacterium]|nr:phosphatase PAP2 family protein [Candidatus Babeliales bacterium]
MLTGKQLILLGLVLQLLATNILSSAQDFSKNLNQWALDRYALNLPRVNLNLDLRYFKQRDAVLHSYERETRYADHYLKNRAHGIAIKNRTFGEWLNDFMFDFIELNRHFFSIDTVKVATGVIPFYLLARSVDHNIHSSFYDSKQHQNLNIFSDSIGKSVSKSVPYVVVTTMLMPYLGHNPDIQLTADIFLKGVISIWMVKDLIKFTLEADACKRPWNGEFSYEKQAFGGFPSGHMAEVFYMTTLFGWRHGPTLGVPFAIYAGFLFLTSISSNRHYASQLIAGAGLGLAYTVASLKLIKTREAVGGWSVDCHPKGFGLTYDF